MTADTYAQALVQATRGKSAHETAERVQRFRKLLERNGHERMLPHIATLVERVLAKEARGARIELVVARKEDARHFAHKIAGYRDQLEASEGSELVERVDDTLIGGFRLRARGTMVDATYKRALLELYRKLSATTI